MNRFWIRSCGLVMSILFAANLFAQPVFEKNFTPPDEFDFQVAKSAFLRSDDLWVMTLDPSSFAPKQACGFCLSEWRVTEVFHHLRSDERALLRAIAEPYFQPSDEHTVAMCFNPRHAIRAIHRGHPYDLVICFECGHAYLYRDGVELGAIPMATGESELVELVESVANRLKAESGTPANPAGHVSRRDDGADAPR